MLKIRLQRVGRKHEPAFRLVLTDRQNSTKSGRTNEILGSYDPRKTTEKLDMERIKHWLGVGAQPTPTVHNLLVEKKIIEGKKINVLPKKTVPEKVEEEAPAAATPADAPAPVETPVETPEEASAEVASDAPVEEEPQVEEMKEEAPAEIPTEEKPQAEEKPAEEKKSE